VTNNHPRGYVPWMELDRAQGPSANLWLPTHALVVISTPATRDKMVNAAMKSTVVWEYSVRGKHSLCQQRFGMIEFDEFLMHPKLIHSNLRRSNYRVSKWPHW
jgi:hypothetical protein